MTYLNHYHVIFSVFIEKCSHLVSEARYNDEDDLSEMLEHHGKEEDIASLINQHLSQNEFKEIWRSSRRSCDQPMDLLFYLATAKSCTLADLVDAAKSDEKGRFQDLIKLASTHSNYLDKRLDDLDYNTLLDISKVIGVKPFPSKEQTKPLWKRLASYFNLKDTEMSSLSASLKDRECLTITFLYHVKTRYPEMTIACLAKSILNINRRDIIVKNGMFRDCKMNGCITI